MEENRTDVLIANRMYKSRIFAMLFTDRNELLELYNAINGTRAVKLPTPKFVIFYNGQEEQPDRKELKLSELFATPDSEPSLELTAVMLNINKGHNKKLMETCRTLHDYAEYTARVREYAAVMILDEAVERAITECINEGILADFLKKNRAEAKKVSIYEYDEERHMRQTREEGMEEGYANGLSQGIIQTAVSMLKLKEFTDTQIREVTGLEQEQLDELKKNINK